MGWSVRSWRPACVLAPAFLLSAPFLSVLVACASRPALQSPDPDTARECYPEGMDAGFVSDGERVPGCASDEICLQGRCYDPCEGDADCGPRELCNDTGVCVSDDALPPDAGRTPELDAGPAIPCHGVECTGGKVCHPLSGTCLACNADTRAAEVGEPGACATDMPVCDVANGVCVAPRAASCAPCNDGSDCVALDESFAGVCVERTVGNVLEQVCLPPCDGETSCPAGLSCDEGNGVCVPPLGVSCTSWRAAVDGASCFSDDECHPLGASAAFFVGACEGVGIPSPDDGGLTSDAGSPPAGIGDAGFADGGGPTPGTCLQPCILDEDCFDAAGGQQCLGGDEARFCRGVPPSTP